MIRFTVLTPDAVLLEAEAAKIAAEGTHGAFVLLPRHADIVVPLPAGVLGWDDAAGTRRWIGHDEAVLVKCGPAVKLAARRAALGDDLAALREHVRDAFLAFAEPEHAARMALTRLEAGVLRRLLDLERPR